MRNLVKVTMSVLIVSLPTAPASPLPFIVAYRTEFHREYAIDENNWRAENSFMATAEGECLTSNRRCEAPVEEVMDKVYGKGFTVLGNGSDYKTHSVSRMTVVSRRAKKEWKVKPREQPGDAGAL